MYRVVGLFRYPLKGGRGESLGEVDVEAGGFRGDRVWACIDAQDGTVGSPKHPGRWGRLLEVSAETVGGEVRLGVAGGRVVVAGTPEADEVLGGFLGRGVRLSRVVPDGARLHRLLPEEPGMVPEWMGGLAPGQEAVTDFTSRERFVDFGAVHVVTTGALERLARGLGRRAVPVARFRPNVVLEAERDPEPGAEVKLDSVVFRVLVPTPRCVVPGLGDSGDGVDRWLLGVLARDHRVTIAGMGAAACFGFYAEVLVPGRLSLAGS
ncbi:MOSC N-terminal beta barrel domain-containing protein [Actinoplanes sp. NPDC051861]|uniref:MOSC domain-containing protein n=1 Tax=Actinoplanes sp. NPDC051861 TaxID=3155170 RepID=UPI00341C256C